MNNLIDRDKAIDLVNRHTGVVDKSVMRRLLECMPPAQPKIIRCETCAFKSRYLFPPKYEEKDYCEKLGKIVSNTDFCSWAKRREE